MQTATAYAQLIPEPPAATQDPIADGIAILCYVLQGHGTARATLEQLERADHAYPMAIAGTETTDRARARFTAARREILQAIARRRAEQPPAEPARTFAPIVSAVSPDGRIRAPRPAPTRPPADQHVAIDF